jgi:hypothetical protein
MAKKMKERGKPGAQRAERNRAAKKPAKAAKPEPKAAKAAKPGKPGKPGKAGKPGKGAAADTDEGRRLGLRGAAPWAARHAAKHAAEARARNAEPPRPGSARATLRTPEQADRIKASVGELHTLVSRIRGMKKTLHDTFFEMGELLGSIKDRELYIAKGYSTFESFVEREFDFGKTVTLRLERVPRVLQKDAAREYGLEAVLAALGTLEDSRVTGTTPALPMKPPTGSKR